MKVFLSGAISSVRDDWKDHPEIGDTDDKKLFIYDWVAEFHKYANKLATRMILFSQLWNFGDSPQNLTDRQLMDLDMHHLRTSNVVVCNPRINPSSLGTMAEVTMAHSLKIPIVMICAEEYRGELHPWLREMASVFADDVEDAYWKVVDLYKY